jgi:5-(carboxyamino)imidazole ribonucleotide synthase
MTVIAPGATIGILGGGQLGRMLAIAAARLGYRCHIFAPDAESPAGDVSAALTRASYDDVDALRAFAGAVDVVTLEFENVPVPAVKQLAALKPVRPGARALQVTQDRLAEKDFARGLALDTAPYRAINDVAELKAALTALGTPAILKTRRLGYDGKGQVRVKTADELPVAIAELGGTDLIYEGLVTFTRELSVVVARGTDGSLAVYPPVENEHRDGILACTLAPAPELAPDQAELAQAVGVSVAEALDHIGVLCVELFDTPDGIVANEIAPRVHNSGHWSIEGAVTSQFENHVRGVLGLPLGDPSARGVAAMVNIVGTEPELAALLAIPGASVHTYGKSPRTGRKLAHVTLVADSVDALAVPLARARVLCDAAWDA